MKLQTLCVSILLLCSVATGAAQNAADSTSSTPPMGWMTWNLYGEKINEQLIRDVADAMEREGFIAAGYNYLFIDDGWQGGRDNRNNLIPDPAKFPSGMKALADYLHATGLKLGLYSDAAQLTCAGYTASYGFEEQDARTFAQWGVDYLKYDYCNAPSDVETARIRYRAMADALNHSGRKIELGICEWGVRQPWLWAADCGGRVWRTTYDVRDKWKDQGDGSMGIFDIIQINKALARYARPGAWNDMDMLVVGLNGTGGPSSDLNSHGCTETEYETQMSLWSMMSSPLAMTNDLDRLDDASRRILLNPEIIAIHQDRLALQAEPKIDNDRYQVYLKPLDGGKWALAILNSSDTPQQIDVRFAEIGLDGRYALRDVWEHRQLARSANRWKGEVLSHQTRVFVLTPQ